MNPKTDFRSKNGFRVPFGKGKSGFLIWWILFEKGFIGFEIRRIEIQVNGLVIYAVPFIVDPKLVRWSKLAKPPFFVAYSRLCRHCRNLAEGGCRLSPFHFRLCRDFLGHVACRNLPWQGLMIIISYVRFSYQKPHRPVSKDTVSRWLKMELQLAGIDTSTLSAHSTRAASTSAAKAQKLSITTIMASAGWSSNFG